MKPIRCRLLIAVTCALAAGCANVKLAPGADQVKLTRNSAEVAGCTPIGNVGTSQPMITDPDAQRQMQNETLALGGNIVLLTSAFGRAGTAYRCGGAAPTAQTTAAPVAIPSPAAAAVQPAPASGAAAPAAQPPVAAPVPTDIVQGQIDALNRRDLEGLLSFYSDDSQVVEYPDRVLMSGKEAMREHFRKAFEPAPQLHATILQRIAFDRFVIDQQKITGRADGQIVEAVMIYEIRDGRIARATILRR